MKPITTISLWLGLITSSTAKPPLFLSYQDSIGQYSFGYSGPMSARSEYRASDGVTRGTYSYVDKNGLIQTAEYEASKELGFRIKATNLPEAPLPVQDTPEVKAAREKHLQLLDEAKRRDESLAQLNAAAEVERIDSDVRRPVLQVAGSLFPTLHYEDKSTAGSSNSQPVQDAQRGIPKNEAAIKPSVDLGVHSSSPSGSGSGSNAQYEPTNYTPEVIAARNAHFRAYENAARVALEADLNPGLLMQYYINQADRAKTSANESKLEANKALGSQFSGNKPNILLLLASGNPSANLKADSAQKESLPIIEDRKIKSPVEKLQTLNLIKTGERAKFGSAQNLGIMNVRGTDTRLPSLNEFEQAKLKAGAYSTPIEISHISPTNLMPILYPSFFGTSLLQYVYL